MARLPKLNYIQSFSAVALAGSLAAATKAGASSQATLSRHIAALEAELNVTLFERRGSGLVLTQTGTNLFEHAEKVKLAASEFTLAAARQEQEVSGPIRISATIGIASVYMPDLIAKLSIKKPEIQIELISNAEPQNLLKREADIAIRTFMPTQENLFVRKIGDATFGAYASKKYIERRGTLISIADLKDHDLIGEDYGTNTFRTHLQAVGLNLTDNSFRFRCDDYLVAWSLLVAGCGISLTLVDKGDAEPRVERILADYQTSLPVWLSSHRELKTSLRVRYVYDFIAKELGKLLAR
jgi:DNA-binding transcriptional LysR family regulator